MDGTDTTVVTSDNGNGTERNGEENLEIVAILDAGAQYGKVCTTCT